MLEVPRQLIPRAIRPENTPETAELVPEQENKNKLITTLVVYWYKTATGPGHIMLGLVWPWGTVDLSFMGVPAASLSPVTSLAPTSWGGGTNESIVLCLFPCTLSHSLLSHLPLSPFTLNKGTLNLSRELYVWVNVAVYHFLAVNYLVREIYRYPRMFGLSAPVHLEINKLFLEIPFVSQSFAQRTC